VKPTPLNSISWAPERFYWASLEARGISGSGPLPTGLRADLLEAVPVPAEELHAVFVATGEKLLVCAARRADLAAVNLAVVSLTPESSPEGLDLRPEALNALELLVGDFEPATYRQQRRRWSAAALVLALMILAFFITGSLRRADHWNRVAAAAAGQYTRVAADLVPGGEGGGRDHGAAIAQLPARIAELQAATRSAKELRPPTDAAARLAQLLASWPTDVVATPQSVVVSDRGVSISVTVPGDAAAFLRRFVPPRGWTLQEPKLSASGAGTRLALNLVPAPPVGAPASTVPAPKDSSQRGDGGGG
jgi:hypothetical protein